jgi:GT2 family glycosyltransferase
MRNPKVAIVILNWNGRFYLESFLPSVYNSSYPNLEFVIGDNASTDDSVSFILENYPLVKVIENDRNYGFAEGYNRILKRVEADYFVLLNSDVEVRTDWIEPVITAMENDRNIAVAQPKLLSWTSRNSFEHAGAAGGFIDSHGYPFCRGRLFDTVETDHGQYDDSGEIFWASGAAFFIRAELWKASGGFDNDFFAHMEEIDLCWRLKRKGYKIWYCADSEVYHIGGGTLDKGNPRKTYLNFRNNLFMIQKNARFPRWMIFKRFWLDFAALLQFAVSGKFDDARAISKAHVDFLKNYRKTQRKRKMIEAGYEVGQVYPHLLVWDYFILRNRHFSALRIEKMKR